jgi:GAF domain-containing protein
VDAYAESAEDASPAAGRRQSLQPPRIPVDESERLAALQRLGILDTPPTESLDRIARLAAKALRVPIVLISLVDRSRQWFKSRIGLEVAETSRDVSFCGHVVFDRKPLVVRDARTDPRFAGNPLVTGEPGIRAYLGIPLFTRTGQAIGTLCAIDLQSRPFRDEEVHTLGEYAKIVESELHALEAAQRV